ncbi:HAD-IIB family hydrolase [bacterium]|nr:HAD-IIB family hydrolase [candidate division CSSED10-310 bacterium]
MPLADRKAIKGILTDIDDTITNQGKLLPKAYEALAMARDAGLLVIPITGRPAGWCDHIARMWPVDGVVGENGGFYFTMREGKLSKRYIMDRETRIANRRKLDRIAEEILAAVPGAGIASDQQYREFDLAIDFCEDVPRLPMSEVQRIVDIFTAHGAVAKISSIHVNGWFGRYDKLTMCKLFFQEIHGIDLNSARDRFLFAGDSPNDEPMFAFFTNSVGVENIKDFEALLRHRPAYLAQGRGGHGFRRLVEVLLGT